jgi:peptide/nickel transport system substrate-binding protein
MVEQCLILAGLTHRAFLATTAGASIAWGLRWAGSDLHGLPTAGAADVKLLAPEPNPKYGGVLRFGIPSTPAHFDLHQSGTVNNLGTQGCMYDNLIRRDPRDGGRTIIPDLAQSWEISPDGKRYTFFLRKGVTFHDGAACTAEDVKATFARMVPDRP